MDLYEALKSGTSEEQLLKMFHRDLDAATARIAKEKEAEEKAAANAEYLSDCREVLANDIVDYIKAFLGEGNCALSIDETINLLKEFEKEMKKAKEFSDKINETLTRAKKENKKPAGTDFFTHLINNSDEPWRYTTSSHNKSKNESDDDDIIAAFIESLK
jgi:hypothetical protein